MANLSLMGRVFRGLVNILAIAGVFFIGYGFVADYTKEVWPPLEKYAVPLSSALTILGTLVTAISIYWYTPTLHAPEEISQKVTAPLVVIGCISALAISFYRPMPPVVVNGFALMAIAGSLLRTQPLPKR